MKDKTGYTGEWIVVVPGIKGPEQASAIWDRIIEVINTSGIEGISVSFDRSRWQGGDF